MTVDFTGDEGPKEVRAGAAVRWPVRVSGGDEARFTVEIATGPDADDAPEWAVAICDSAGEICQIIVPMVNPSLFSTGE